MDAPTMNEMRTLTLIQKYVCESQLYLSQYSHSAGEKHKRVKDLVGKLSFYKDFLYESSFYEPFLEEKYKEINSQFLEELRYCFAELEHFLRDEFLCVFQSAYKFIQQYFSGRSIYSPRACIKVPVKNKIYTLARSENFQEEQEITFDTSLNSAFENITNGANYFICQDIPLAADPSVEESKRYKNARLDSKKVAKYNQARKKGEPVSQSRYGYDTDWASCWKNILNNKADKEFFESCYKSTLVVPMSLLKRRLTKEFAEQFQVDKSRETAQKDSSEKILFGFLCFDHCDSHFFSEESDWRFAYIMADVLSLYLIEQLVHTKYSSAYRKAVSLLDERG